MEIDYSPDSSHYDIVDRDARDAFKTQTGYDLYDGEDIIFSGRISLEAPEEGTGRYYWRKEQIQYWARRLNFFFHRVKKICDEVEVEKTRQKNFSFISSELMQAHAHYSMLFHKIKRDIKMLHPMIQAEIYKEAEIN